MPFEPRPRLKTMCAFVLAVCLILATLSGCERHGELRQASGIARAGSEFIIVGNGTPGTVFRYPIPEVINPAASGSLLATIEIGTAEKMTLGGPLVLDPESIDVLVDGRIAVLSERLRALVTHDGVAAAYPLMMTEIGGRGLEGLAVNADGRIAALWEGGFPGTRFLPSSIKGTGRLDSGPFKPLVCVHSLPAVPGSTVCPFGEGVIALQIPDTPLPTQVFRAPDLVWDEDGKSFIVLLNSLNVDSTAFGFKWLQRFSVTGEAIGEPFNLCDRGFLPNELRGGKDGNFEGLAWYEKGKSLVTINDYGAAATAVIIAVDPWPVTDNTVNCEQAIPSS